MTRIAAPRDRRNVTVMFVDVVGSTALIKKLNEELAHSILAPAIQAIAIEVQRFSGYVSRILGDGVMAIFGVPYTLEDHAARAANAALSIQEQMSNYGHDLNITHGLNFQVRIGLNSGSVVISVAGEGEHELYDASGLPVHLAARIESKTPAGSIGVSSRTQQLCAAAFEFELLGSFNLKGFTEPEPIFRLVRTRNHVSSPAETKATVVPMVGRGMQRRQFVSAVAAVDQGHGGLVLIRGEAGSGKTRLLRECREIFGAELKWLQGQSTSYDLRVSYWPFVKILEDWLALTARDDESENWTILVHRMQELFVDEAEGIVPYIAALMGMDLPAPYLEKTRYLEPDVLGRQVFKAMRRLFARMSAQKPLIVVIEDFHWSDDSSVSLLMHLLELCLEARFLVCVTSRLDGIQANGLLDASQAIKGLSVTSIEVAPLSIEHGIEMIERLIGKDPDAKSLRDRILYKAGGNPFFIEEVVRSLASSGLLLPGAHPGAWSVVSKDIAVPDTIHDVVMARVDRLDARLKHLLHVASVIGHHFLYTILREVGKLEESIDGSLTELTQRQFIEAIVDLPEATYMFKHALTQEAVYGSLLSEKRKHLHEQVGDNLLEIFAGRADAFASVIAFHYARAEQHDKALRYLLEAAEQSIKVAAGSEALRYYEEALATYDKVKNSKLEPWQRATIECRLAEAYHHRGLNEAAHEHFERALKACGEAMPQSRPGLVMALVWQTLVQLAHRIGPQRKPVQAAYVDKLEAIRYRIYETYTWLLGVVNQEKMGYAIVRFLNVAESPCVADPMAKATSGFGFTLDILGFHRLARSYHSRAERWALESGNISTIALAANMHGLHDAYVGEWDDALVQFAKADKLATQVGDLNNSFTAGLHRMQVLQERGELDAVLDVGVALVRQGRETGHNATSYLGLAVLGCALWRLGSSGRARRPLEEGLRRANNAGDHLSETFIEGELALCLLAEGDLNAAATRVESAVARIQRFNVRSNPVGTVMNARAELAIARLGANRSPRSIANAKRACREGLVVTRQFHFGFPRALRLMGTYYWIEGSVVKAEHWWTKSLTMSQKLKSKHEEALTLVEVGQRTGRAAQQQLGEEMLKTIRHLVESSKGIEAAVNEIGSEVAAKF